MERRIVSVWSFIVAIISEYTPPTDLLAVLKNDSDARTDTADGQSTTTRTPLFIVVRGVAVLPNTGASIAAKNSSSGLIYKVSHRNSMRNRMVQPDSGIINGLLHVLTRISVANLLKGQTKLPKVMLIGVHTNLPAIIVRLNHAPTFSKKRGSRTSMLQTLLQPYSTEERKIKRRPDGKT